MTVKVVGLDLSMTGTGVAWTGADGEAHTCLIASKKEGDIRLTDIRRQVMGKVGGNVDLVLIEGYLNKSFSAGITGMVHGAVRSALIEAGIPYATLPPTNLKKYATGRGGASKTDMAVAAFKRGGVEFTNDNECDSWWLWQAAMTYLLGFDRAPLKMPAVNCEAMDKIKMEV